MDLNSMRTILKVVALLIHEETRKQIEAALSRIEGINISLRMVGDDRSLSEVGLKELPDVVMFEVNGHREKDIADIENILKEHGDRISVFVTTKGSDVDTTRRLMRAGVKDVYPQPLQVQEMVIGVSKVLADKRAMQRSAQGKRGGLTAFMNAKGGSGATTLAVNVAYLLRRNYDASVALIDMDIQFGSAATLLDLKPRSNVMDALLEPDRLDPIFLRALMTHHSSGLEILASPGDLSSYDGISEQAVTQLMHVAVENYDFVIVDMPRVFMPWTYAILALAEPVMLVVQNDIPTIHDARLLIEHLPLKGIAIDAIEIVNNRAMSKMHSVSIDSLKEVLHKKRVHRVRNDYEAAADAQDQGLLVVEIDKRSDMTRDIESFAENLAKSHFDRKEDKSGLFKKLFGHAN
ncbi:CpaE family protein [Sulfuriflexus sp.]|uniref:AAA family ATPase n=1 Tax=Sulfuriflexus sp. TaxID=2015443 RepID=UPI0028CEC21A|nr:AAA family ATPase [Sulfuriflexus sp.]MDT8403035.1 AAA family ATPase [Sulfuriflexus sp.]